MVEVFWIYHLREMVARSRVMLSPWRRQLWDLSVPDDLQVGIGHADPIVRHLDTVLDGPRGVSLVSLNEPSPCIPESQTEDSRQDYQSEEETA